MTTKIGFEVKSLEAAKKDGCVCAIIKFDEGVKEYTFVRKFYNTKTSKIKKFVVDGVEVTFNKDDFSVLGYVRIGETTGKKKFNTTNIGGKIKKEIKTKEIKMPKVISVESGEVHHERYEEIKMCLECNIPIYLAGPAGAGKNYTVEQIAKELGWDFYFSNSVQQEYKLTGFIDAGGKFHDTEFYKACTCENDCIFFLDEMDASIPEVLVLLNAAIANGYFEFPTGKVSFDKVHFVAAGNTVGSGADDMYTGRMVLDQATLDRFAIIEFNYSLAIEMSITNNNVELVNFIHEMREEAEKKGIRATFSYRCMTMVTKLEKAGMSLQMAMTISVVKGLDKDTLNTFNPIGHSKYHEALKKVQMAA